MNEKLTLFIPTQDRSAFVGRLLSYYQGLRFPGRILIADSSQKPEAVLNQQTVQRLETALGIEYLHDPGFQLEEAFRWAARRVATPYVVYQGDDDLFIPRGLETCVRFLEENPQYHAANGSAVVFKTDWGGPFGEITFTGRYQALQGAQAPTARERFLHLLAFPSVMTFCIHRTESWRTIWGSSTASQDVPYTTELLPSFLCAVQGKVKRLDCLYLMRQAHPNRVRHTRVFDWLRQERFSEGLVELLARTDGISMIQARQVVQKGFSSLEEKTRSEGVFRRISRAAPPWPRTRHAWRWVRSYFPGAHNEFLLPALTRSSSRFHADFLPVHQIVTGGSLLNGHNP